MTWRGGDPPPHHVVSPARNDRLVSKLNKRYIRISVIDSEDCVGVVKVEGQVLVLLVMRVMVIHGYVLLVPTPMSAGTGFTWVWVRVNPNLPMGYLVKID